MPSTINWTQVHTRPTLMIPGPTELAFPVIQAMNQPPSIQYDRSFDEGVLEPTTLAPSCTAHSALASATRCHSPTLSSVPPVNHLPRMLA